MNDVGYGSLGVNEAASLCWRFVKVAIAASLKCLAAAIDGSFLCKRSSDHTATFRLVRSPFYALANARLVEPIGGLHFERNGQVAASYH